MKRPGLFLVIAGAALLGAGLMTAVPARAGGDDVKKMEALKAKRDKFRKDLRDKGWWPYLDLSHGVNAKGAGLDSRWSCSEKPHDQATEDKGVQLIANWESKMGAGADIRVVVQKWEQSNSAANTVSTMNFEHAGQQCKVAELEKMCDGFYQDWLKQATDLIADACEKPKKARGMGPADWYATATGNDPESKKRERHEWFLWATPNTTWMATIVYQANTLDKPDWLAFGVDVMKATKELKAPTK